MFIVIEAKNFIDGDNHWAEITGVNYFTDENKAIEYAQSAIETCPWGHDIAVWDIQKNKKIFPEINWHTTLLPR